MEKLPDGRWHYSWAKIQSFIAFFYFLVIYTRIGWSATALPDVPDGWIFLISVSSAAFLIAKYQNQRQNSYFGSSYGYGSDQLVFNGPGNQPNQLLNNDEVPIPGPDGPSVVVKSVDEDEEKNKNG